MTIKPLGDSAWLIEYTVETCLDVILAWVAALQQNRPAGVVDVLSSFNSIAVHYTEVEGLEIPKWIQNRQIGADTMITREVVIPVIYGGVEGPDLQEVARHTGKSVSEVIAEHSAAIYTVAALGFSPGFPYLSGLPESLQMPRRKTPRNRVASGSVAIAGAQAGIYPNASPAGWHVLGRTNVPLFNPYASSPTLLKPGDRVRFVPCNSLPEHKIQQPPEATPGEHWIEVIEPGAMTTIQDLGRPGYESLGVSPGGAVDRWALRAANAMVGNSPNAAALECCVRGPVLKFHRSTTIAFMGASGKTRKVSAGEIVDFSKLDKGVRAYIAIAGGLNVPLVLGSSATDVRACFGGMKGRSLVKGDRLECDGSISSPKIGNWSVGREERQSSIVLRFISGVQADWFSEVSHRRFSTSAFQVSPSSDRMGARLLGPLLQLHEPREMISQPVACGSVQVPPDGQPIVLLAERQTMGGYPQIGHVISVDLPKLARAWPGTEVRFQQISWEEAVQLRCKAEIDFERLRCGLELLT